MVTGGGLSVETRKNWGSCQKVENSSCKINTKYVIYKMVNVVNIAIWYIGKFLRQVDPKNSHHRKILTFFIVSIRILTKHSVVIISQYNQTTMLYPLSLYGDACELFLSKTEKCMK